MVGKFHLLYLRTCNSESFAFQKVGQDQETFICAFTKFLRARAKVHFRRGDWTLDCPGVIMMFFTLFP